MRKYRTISTVLIFVVALGGMASADLLTATPASSVGSTLTIGESDFNYEGNARIDGYQNNVGNPDPQGWFQDIYDTNITWSASDGVATV